ncbi:MAG: zf-HC2 domain-containing protein, partial [bacterium]|nr:zf-HC2 domain-containing protein [bacterium]
MSCDEYKDYLEAYCDDVLPPQISQKVETHIKGCESCRKSVCEYQSLNALLNSYVEDRVPEERFAVMRDSILQRILNDERVVIPLDDTVPEPAAITLADRFDSLVSQFLSGFWRKAAITVTCVVIILVGLHFRPNPETALVEPLQTESTGNLAIDPMDIPDVPVEETTGEV